MSATPPPIPPRYRMAAPAEPVQPKQAGPPVKKKRRLSQGDALFRTAIVVMILSSISVAYWSFFHRLQPVQKESRTMLSKVTEMSAKLDALERRWTPEDIRRIRAEYPRVYTNLFADDQALVAWLERVQEAGIPLGLDLDVKFGTATPLAINTNGLATIPASISVQVLPAAEDAKERTPYERVLAFGEQLAREGKRADIAEVSVEGGEDSVRRATFVFTLWAGTPDPPPASPAGPAAPGGKKK